MEAITGRESGRGGGLAGAGRGPSRREEGKPDPAQLERPGQDAGTGRRGRGARTGRARCGMQDRRELWAGNQEGRVPPLSPPPCGLQQTSPHLWVSAPSRITGQGKMSSGAAENGAEKCRFWKQA